MPSILETFGAEVIVAVIAVFMAAAWLIGYASGRHHVRTHPEDAPVQGKITEACLAIMGLLLAFCFAAGYSKFETRRQTVIREANSIGTFSIRAELLPEPVKSSTKQRLKEYVQLHLDVVKTSFDLAAMKDLGRQMMDLQGSITGDVINVLQMPEYRMLAVPILASLNDMLDQYEVRVAARLDHVPISVSLLLLVVSVVTSLMLGRSQGVLLHHRPWVTIVFLLLVVFIIYITIDLDQPWHGLSRTSQVPMERLARSMGIQTP